MKKKMFLSGNWGDIMNTKFKSVLSSIIVLVAFSLMVYAIPFAGFAETNKITGNLSELINSESDDTYPVWIFLDDKNAPDFLTLATNKISPVTEKDMEAYHSMSEDEQTELLIKVKQEIVEEYYEEKNNDAISSLGIDKESVSYISKYTASFKCELTGAKIKDIAENNLIETISLYNSEAPTEQASEATRKVTKAEFIDLFVSEDKDFSDGGFIYRGNLKFDAIEEGDGYALIVYGIDEQYYTPHVGVDEEVLRINSNCIIDGDASFTSGMGLQISSNDKSKTISTIIYINNVLPGFPNPASDIIEASRYKTFDIAQYIYPEIVSGDIDCDGMVTASDASLILKAYSYFSTGTPMTLNSSMCDVNNDSRIDASDASQILEKYAEASTGKEA